jgi:GNAT superfamily N-acetyltransferase
MEIRHGKPADAPAVKKLIDQLYVDPEQNPEQYQASQNGFLRCKRNLRQVKAIINKAAVFLVAEDQGTLVGFMGYHNRQDHTGKKSIKWQNKQAKKVYPNKNISSTGQIAGIDPDYQSQGLGAKLMTQIEGELRKKGYKYAFVTIIDDPLPNIASQKFVQKMGYKKVAEGPQSRGSEIIVNIYFKNLTN